MFSKLSLLATSLLVTLAVANYPPPPAGTANQCCGTVANNKNPVVTAVAAAVGVDLSGILGNIGVNCNPITVLGNTCSQTAVNCNANQLGKGLINVGCVPITI
ncbi:hydrophobin-3 [Mycena pura]|uniref:Hydrophobin n=1 Tax=Mycena pura TaxID=153505 RepID=A0AAD6YED4_9AGAR|nr:hydrophobin-3 [Mycena pura]